MKNKILSCIQEHIQAAREDSALMLKAYRDDGKPIYFESYKQARLKEWALTDVITDILKIKESN